MNNTINIGDILVTNVGATMTLPVFYRVTKVTPKTVKLIALKSKSVDGDGLIGHCIPTEEENSHTYRAHATARIIPDSKYGFIAKNSSDRLYYDKWNGKPQYYNHLD